MICDVPSHKSIFNRVVFLSCYLEKSLLIKCHYPHNRDMLSTINSIAQLDGFVVSRFGYDVRITVHREPTRTSHYKRVRIDESGATLRFIVPMLIYYEKCVCIYGYGTLRNRPILDFLYSLKEVITYMYSSDNSSYKIVITRRSDNLNKIRSLLISSDTTSQYISSAIIACSKERTPKYIILKNSNRKSVSTNYISSTISLLRSFGRTSLKSDTGGQFICKNRLTFYPRGYEVDSDYSSIVTIAVAAILKRKAITMRIYRNRSTDLEIKYILEKLFVKLSIRYMYTGDLLTIIPSNISAFDISFKDHIEYFPTLTALAIYSRGKSVLRDIVHSKYHESDRTSTVVEALNMIGFQDVNYDGQSLNVIGKTAKLSGVFPCFNDHRVAICGALISLVDRSVTLDNPGSIDKSFVNFLRYIEDV